MDTAHWPQEFCSVKGMEELVPSAGSHGSSGGGGGGGDGDGDGGIEQQERRAARPQKEQAALQCPRCCSTNTKFCYYNNYSLTQPRYYCKTCRRYWTAGGSLRNVPVGGGSRKNRRSTSSTPTSTTTSGIISSTQKPKLSLQAFPMLPEPGSPADISAMELLGRGLSPFMPMHPMPVLPMSTTMPEYSTSGFVAVHQDYRSNGLNFPLDGISGGYGSVQEANGRLLFPFEDSRQVVTSSTTTSNDHRGQGGDATGFWSGMIGGGSGGGGAGGGSW